MAKPAPARVVRDLEEIHNNIESAVFRLGCCAQLTSKVPVIVRASYGCGIITENRSVVKAAAGASITVANSCDVVAGAGSSVKAIAMNTIKLGAHSRVSAMSENNIIIGSHSTVNVEDDCDVAVGEFSRVFVNDGCTVETKRFCEVEVIGSSSSVRLGLGSKLILREQIPARQSYKVHTFVVDNNTLRAGLLYHTKNGKFFRPQQIAS